MSSDGDSDPDRTETLYALHDALQLDGKWVDGGDSFFEGLRLKTSPKFDIDEFLEHYPGWNAVAHKWAGIPDNPKWEDKRLYYSLAKHIKLILQHFHRAPHRAVAVHGNRTFHKVRTYDIQLTSTPPISLLAYGPGFVREQYINGTSTLAQCAAPIAVKTQYDLDIFRDRVQLAIYARRCFMLQPNRRFVYGLLLTEKMIQLYQFDRAGALFSKQYNMRKNPKAFVRMILLVSTLDEEELGLDPCITWKDNRRYFTPHSEQEPRYRIVDPYRPFHRCAIYGRGTTCWRVRDSTKTDFLLKFSWQTLDADPEWKFLRAITAANPPLQYVGSMESHKEIKSISSLRHGISLISEEGQPIPDREHCWILQPYYGPPIEHFDSTLEFLEAFRDAVLGSKELLGIGILHRDISPQNILLHRSESKTTGVLIDFDYATFLSKTVDDVKTNSRIGTRDFQSLGVLYGLPGHSYLDELESCFYVFCWIIFSHEARLHPDVSPMPWSLIKWGSDDIADAISAKMQFLESKFDLSDLPLSMGGYVAILFFRLHTFFARLTEPIRRHIHEDKIQAQVKMYGEQALRVHALFESQTCHAPYVKASVVSLPDVDESECTEWLDAEALKNYTAVLNFVNEAIESERNSPLGSQDSEEETVASDPGDVLEIRDVNCVPVSVSKTAETCTPSHSMSLCTKRSLTSDSSSRGRSSKRVKVSIS